MEYCTLAFPKYIQEFLISKSGIVKLMTNSNTDGIVIVLISKDGAEMTKDTINVILSGELPFVKQILNGKTISLKL